MAKGGSEFAVAGLECQEAAGEYWRAVARAGGGMGAGTGVQAKLHQWAGGDPARRFDDLFNLVTDPAVLQAAWERVRSNRGARTAGVDGQTAYYVERVRGVEEFLTGLRGQLRSRRFAPVTVRERMIPKASGKLRRLGIPTLTDRVVQAALKLVLDRGDSKAGSVIRHQDQGGRGRGYAQFLATLDEGRISIAALSTGLAQGCVDESVAYVRERHAFGGPIGRFQALQFKIADYGGAYAQRPAVLLPRSGPDAGWRTSQEGGRDRQAHRLKRRDGQRA